MNHQPRIAIVHDYLVARGGAERLLLLLAEEFPNAPIYTSIHRQETTLPEFAELDVRTLWPSRLPVDNRTYRPWILAYAYAFERLQLPNYDLTISVSSSFAKSAGSLSKHRLAVCLTPPRFIWPCGASSDDAGRLELAGRQLLRPLLRRMVRRAARRIAPFLAISAVVRDRIRLFYGRESTVVNPPIDCSRFALGTGPRRGFLTVGRLVRYKGFDRVIATLSKVGRPLTVVGTGPDERRLRMLAGTQV